MHALIDGDVVCYRCAISANQEGDERFAVARTHELMRQILATTGAETFTVYLSGENNFRQEIYPAYKANRTQPRPLHLQACRAHLVLEFAAELANGCEADDLLGVAQTALGNAGTSIICSIDKDLKMIPGKHYNFVKDEFDEISYFQGLSNFYKQLLTGDRTDNIPGIAGVGPVKAAKAIDPCIDEEQMLAVCKNMYNNDEELLLNGQLLWIWREIGDIWKIPQF